MSVSVSFCCFLSFSRKYKNIYFSLFRSTDSESSNNSAVTQISKDEIGLTQLLNGISLGETTKTIKDEHNESLPVKEQNIPKPQFCSTSTHLGDMLFANKISLKKEVRLFYKVCF